MTVGSRLKQCNSVSRVLTRELGAGTARIVDSDTVVKSSFV